MIGEFQKQKDGTYTVSVKLQASQVELLNAICNALGVNSYQIFQMFFYTLMRASAPMHELSPEIRKIMTLMESDAGWAEAFNMANPNDLDVAQCILILQQKDKRGFGAVMIDRPFMSDARMTECVDDIMERTFEVTMRGVYHRMRRLMGAGGYIHLTDMMLTMLDAQTIIELDAQDQIEMKGEGMYDHRGRKIEYGKKTKTHGHRTPDSVAQDQRFNFEDWEGEHRQTDFQPPTESEVQDD